MPLVPDKQDKRYELESMILKGKRYINAMEYEKAAEIFGKAYSLLEELKEKNDLNDLISETDNYLEEKELELTFLLQGSCLEDVGI